MKTIDVKLPTQRYRIMIEAGLLDRLGELTAAVAPHARALLAIDANIIAAYGPRARTSLEAAGYEVLVHELVAEERHKTLETVRGMYDAMLAFRLERASPVAALGGGVVGDIAGFAAATYLRGVPVVQVPTTLLAMVDASIGGKTGVNLPLPADALGVSTLGKNLVGAFWQPRAVIVDPTVLGTLDRRHFRCGLAECVKHGLLAGADLLAFIEANAPRIAGLDMDILTELIARSASIKVDIVQADEREAGRRALLNLGHTFAHVIEPIEELDLRHGEAVAIGLCAAARCAMETGRLGRTDVQYVTGLLEGLSLPTRLPRAESAARLTGAMIFDKKVAGDRIRLVLPTAIGEAAIVDDVQPEAISAAWRAVGAADA